MLDKYNRKINYLRISVTDRCNLRCKYCMPETGIKMLNRNDILSFEEIIEIIKICLNYGIDKIRITGGEPLIRKNIVMLFSMISKIDGIKDIAMSTNAILLEKYAYKLVNAGLHRVNISLDAINPEKYSEITRGGDITQVFKGIEAAQLAGLYPIKVNCVVMKSSNEKDALEVAEFCKKNNLQVRFIHQMNFKTGEFSVVEGGDGGNCKNCNRLRLTANGLIKPCLFNDKGYDIRKLGIEEALKMAVSNKPEYGTLSYSNEFYYIGG